MSVTRDCGTTPTATESVAPAEPARRGTFGVFWVAPTPRFDPLTASTLFGRSPSCGVKLDGHQVSREHARIERDGPIWRLRDLDSKNGTWVNACRQQVARLQEQDVVRIGDFVGVLCTWEEPSAEVSAAFESLLPEFVSSAPTRAALGAIPALATCALPILVRGETGTGKELVVQAFHRLSGRVGRLVAVNCAAIPETMAESLFFGHRKGAFTGAQSCTQGYVQAAQGGTLFLDEVAELPVAVQAKLLRVLEERALTPLGGSESVQIDFRLIAACQEPLSDAVAAGEFRQDLYARLKGAEVLVPPLRARRQEVGALLSSFFAQSGGRQPVFGARALEALCAYHWPHNVREVRQLAGLLAASGKQRLDLDDLPLALCSRSSMDDHLHHSEGSERASPSQRRQAWLARHVGELDQLLNALSKHQGNVTLAAREAGVPRSRARRLLAAHAERTDAVSS